MFYRVILRLVLMSVFLASCSLPGMENPPEGKIPTATMITEQPTPTVQADLTNTPILPNTPDPTDTPTLPVEPSPAPSPEVWYILQPGTPLATYNTPHEAAGCSWLGVGGQVFGIDTEPILGLSILVGGTLDGNQVGSLGTTGMETNIGEGGYEVTLADQPVDSNGTLWIQIVDSIGNPLSEKIYFDSFNDCNRNFILINFIHYQASLPTNLIWPAYLPLITNPSDIQITPAP